jgi:hypothetical protein
MLKRFAVIIFALGLLGAGCQEKTPPANAFVSGTDDLKILDSRLVSTGDAAGSTVGGGTQSYAIFKIHFTNNLSEQLFPIISHFVLVTPDGARYNATDSGSTALIGISNDVSPMLKGTSRDFTIGFRIGLQPVGQIVYEY